MTRTETLISICNPDRITGPLPEVSLGSLRQDSRQVTERDVFIAIRGLTVDGHLFITDAIRQGAAVIICEEIPADQKENCLFLQVPSTRSVLGPLAQEFHGNPSKKLKTIAVTGTNGKTTVTTLVWQTLQRMNIMSGLLGTVNKQFGEEREESRLTTSDPVEIAADMRKMVNKECRVAAMEVSSHALAQERTSGIQWDIAAFTNLSHDHLDYHGGFDEYLSAKKSLFDSLESSSSAIINLDDPCGKQIVADCPASVTGFTFGDATGIRCNLLRSSANGLVLSVDGTEITSPLAGTFNAYNLAEAFLICRSLGYEPEPISQALSNSTGAPGRLEKVGTSDDKKSPIVFVDYAHTPDALENVAATLNEVKEPHQMFILLFGCGGDRDRRKRPLMAQIAEKQASRILVTSDNPRYEDPEEIINDIENGFSANASYEVILSRKEAIRQAIVEAPDRAVVLIAGKGHETWQEINGERYPFDDREIAHEALKERKRIQKGRAD